ncbi:hypothetical protein [Kordiimonas sp.]|uniref:hypothetical protein n=1 Tax=Kordiimonas sp. TaxID=1970157 RepID=UPI003A948ECB
MEKKSNQNYDFLERRRQLLKMGAAGMPMILTLKASANQAVHSALDCAFMLTSAVNILVDHEGKVWIGDGSIQQKNDGRLKSSDIASFKSNADFVFPSNSAPGDYIPDACPDDGCDTDDSGGWDDDDWYFGSSGKDLLQQLKDSGNVVAFTGRYGSSDDDDDDCRGGGDDDDYWDDDDGYSSSSSNSGWTDCGYNYYQISANTTITPLDYMNQSGDWQISGTGGLYIALGAKYLDYYGNDGGFPGISCLHSILAYLETT